MRTTTVLVTILLSTSLIAGCIVDPEAQSISSAPPSASAAEFTDDTGAITGIITSEENLPLSGAAVGLLETQTTTSSALDGTYTLSNIPPGDYSLTVASLGYETAAKRVTVEPGGVVQANFQLAQVPIDEPYSVSDQQFGNIQCSVTFFPGVPLTGVIASGWYTGVQVCGVASVPTLPPSKFILTFNVTEGTQEMLMEMTWVSTQILGTGLSVNFEHPNGVNNGQPVFGSAVGKSPLKVYANHSKVLEVTEAQGEDYADCSGCEVITRAFSAANTTEFYLPTELPELPEVGAPSNKIDAGFAFDQRFEQWVTYFVNQGMPAEFSALPDA